MSRHYVYPAVFLLAAFAVLPSAAQEAAPPPRPVPIAAAKGVPDLKQFPRIRLVLPNETVPLDLNIASQTPEGRFAGEAVRAGSPPSIVMGLIEATDTGGFMVEFTVEPKGGSPRLFQGSVFVAEAVGTQPRKVMMSGIYQGVTGDNPTDGPFPFVATAVGSAVAPTIAAERAAARRAAEAGQPPVVAAPAAGGIGNLVRQRLLRIRGVQLAPTAEAPTAPVAPAGVAKFAAGNQVVSVRNGVTDLITLAPKNVMEALERRNNMKTFLSLVKAAGLEDTYRKVKMTVFAPEDAAFQKLPFGVLDSLRKTPANAKQYVGYCTSYQHKYVTKGPAGAEGLPPTEVDVNTGRLGISRSNGRLWIMGNDSRRAPVLEESIDAGLGALYVTGVVLIQKSVRFD